MMRLFRTDVGKNRDMTLFMLIPTLKRMLDIRMVIARSMVIRTIMSMVEVTPDTFTRMRKRFFPMERLRNTAALRGLKTPC